MVEWIIRNHQDWHEITALEVCARIAQKAADVIHDANYDVFPEYREEWLSNKQIENWAKKKNASALFMIALEDNRSKKMENLYARAGFKPIERTFMKEVASWQ